MSLPALKILSSAIHENRFLAQALASFVVFIIFFVTIVPMVNQHLKFSNEVSLKLIKFLT